MTGRNLFGAAADIVARSPIRCWTMTLDQVDAEPELDLGLPPSPSAGQRFTFSEAARLTRTSRSTIKRRHAAGAFPAAVKDPDGAWLIPLGDLLAAGLVPSDRPPLLDQVEDQAQDGVIRVPGLDHRDAELAELRQALAVEVVKREAAERLATERLDRVDDLRRALRVLEPAPVRPAIAPPSRRRWWTRTDLHS